MFAAQTTEYCRNNLQALFLANITDVILVAYEYVVGGQYYCPSGVQDSIPVSILPGVDCFAARMMS